MVSYVQMFNPSLTYSMDLVMVWQFGLVGFYSDQKTCMNQRCFSAQGVNTDTFFAV